MCGIVGYKLLNRNPEQASKALDLFRLLLVESQIRGKHATGVAYVDDGKVFSYKKPMPAEEFVKEPIWAESFECFIPTEMIGHTRYSTSGDWHENKNNQPLNNRSLAIVHNGLVSMATQDEFCEEYRVQTATANDTEIILRKVLDEYRELGTVSYRTVLVGVLRDVDPIYALATLDSQGNILVGRDDKRPLWVFWVGKYDMIGFASTKDIIERAAKTHGLERNQIVISRMPENTVASLSVVVVDSMVKVKERSMPRYNPAPLPTPHAGDKGLSLNPTFADGDHRNNLRESFKRYCAASVATWEIDPNYPMLNYIFRRFEMSKAQQYWACFLYGTFYHPGSVFYVMQEFPEFEKVDLGRLQRWHTLNWKQLRYNTDRKYEKGHFVEMFESYRNLIGSQEPDAQDKFFTSLIGSDPQESFRAVTKALLSLVRFGRYSVYIYTEALARCMGLPLEADNMFLKGADSPRAGLAIVLERPEWAEGALTGEQWAKLEVESEILLDEIRGEYPSLNMDKWFMESCLCAYKGFFRATRGRYLPYYLDRMADEIKQMQDEGITSGIDWNVLWQFRQECLPHEYLGEKAKPVRLKIHKPYEHVLRDTGRMVGLYPAIQRGIVSAKAVGK